MKRMLVLLAAGLLGSAAYGADLPVKAAPKLKVVNAVVPCTVLLCQNKFYIGGGVAGVGTNADIIGNGLAGSVFAGGAIPFADVGWLTWNGSFLLGAEAGVGYQLNVGNANVNGAQVNEKGFMAYQEFQVGGSLSSLFGGQPPVSVPSGLSGDVMAPYVSMGVEEHSFATGWRTGAGVKFVLPSSNILLDLGYRYTNFGSATTGSINFNAINTVYAKFDVPLN